MQKAENARHGHSPPFAYSHRSSEKYVNSLAVSNNYRNFVVLVPPSLFAMLKLGDVLFLYVWQYHSTNNALRKKIAAHFSLTVPVFSSWLTIIVLTRNACCHHARMWNKENAIPPVEPRRMTLPWITSVPTTRRIYFNLCIIRYFISRIDCKNNFTEALQNLLAAYPMVDLKAMGFPLQWKNEPLWQDE